MPKRTSHKELSRTEWSRDNEQWPGFEAIYSGTLQRIADATELMAKSHQQLIDERDKYKKWYEDYRKAYDAKVRSERAYKAHLTRLRRQLHNKSFACPLPHSGD